MESTYTPVQYAYREVIQEQIDKSAQGRVFYFDDKNSVESVDGKIISMEETPGKGMFITLESGVKIRIDRIITLFGKPGAAYDEYDAFANACLDCTGGYDLD